MTAAELAQIESELRENARAALTGFDAEAAILEAELGRINVDRFMWTTILSTLDGRVTPATQQKTPKPVIAGGRSLRGTVLKCLLRNGESMTCSAVAESCKVTAPQAYHALYANRKKGCAEAVDIEGVQHWRATRNPEGSPVA